MVFETKLNQTAGAAAFATAPGIIIVFTVVLREAAVEAGAPVS